MPQKRTKIIVLAIIGTLLVGGAVFAIVANQRTNNNQGLSNADLGILEPTVEEIALAEEQLSGRAEIVEDGLAQEQAGTTATSGNYVSLADYETNSVRYESTTKVYFFHASWCPICRAIDEEINDDTTKIPANVTMIKTDFDEETELRQKYGVTTQYTFVQVDESGNEVAQWSATSLDDAIAGIKS